MANRKRTERLSAREIYDFIAKRTKCPRTDVKAIFDVYKQLIVQIFNTTDTTGLKTIELPNVGYFYFRRKHGAKAGTYVLPSHLGVPQKTVVKESDDPDYVVLYFKAYKTVRDYLKDKCQGKIKESVRNDAE